MANYSVSTKFGDITVVRDNIKEARAWAKSAHRVGPECVTPQRVYNHCATCECAPCCCKGAS